MFIFLLILMLITGLASYAGLSADSRDTRISLWQ